MRGCKLAGATIAVFAMATAPAAAAGPLGALSQPAGLPGCYSDTGESVNADGDPNVCTNVRAVYTPYGAAISPDGRNLYVANQGNGIAVFSREPSGALTQLPGLDGCVTTDGTAFGDETAIGCRNGRALQKAIDVVVSPDGRHVYASGYDAPAETAAFSRDPQTGALTQIGCVSNDGSATGDDPDDNGDGCTNARGGAPAYQLLMSRDGTTVWVAATHAAGGVQVLRRDPQTGALSQAADATACTSSDGEAHGDDVGDSGDGCSNGRAVPFVVGLAQSPDGRHLYASSATDELGVFAVDPATGGLTQTGCVSNDGHATGDDAGDNGDGCTNVRAHGDGWRVEVSPDGRHVYTASYGRDEMAAFARDAVTGALTQLPEAAGCLSNTGVASGDDADDNGDGCTDARALSGAYPLAIGSEGVNVYVGGYDGGELAVLTRDPVTGALSQASTPSGCISLDGNASGDAGAVGCLTGRGLFESADIQISPDGSSLYVVGYRSAIGRFVREVAPICRDTSASTAFGVPVAVPLDCSDANGDPLTISVGSAGSGSLGPVDQAARSVTFTPGSVGPDAFPFSASDGMLTSNLATATVAVGGAPPAPPPPGPVPPLTPRAPGPPTPPVTLELPRVAKLLPGRIRIDSRGRGSMRLDCPAGVNPCTGNYAIRTLSRVTLRAASTRGTTRRRIATLARGRYRVRAGTRARVRFTIGPKGRRLLRRSRSLRVRVVIDPTGPTRARAARTTLVAPKARKRRG